QNRSDRTPNGRTTPRAPPPFRRDFCANRGRPARSAERDWRGTPPHPRISAPECAAPRLKRDCPPPFSGAGDRTRLRWRHSTFWGANPAPPPRRICAVHRSGTAKNLDHFFESVKLEPIPFEGFGKLDQLRGSRRFDDIRIRAEFVRLAQVRRL